jgi:23S rRNA (adenine2503-C2)-methyltransferase
MPIEQAHAMDDILASVREHAAAGDLEDRVTFEYVLLKGVNDSPEQAHELAKRIQGIRGKVNLLPFNPHEGAPYARPTDEAVERFRLALRAEGVDAFVRKSRGRDIAAACGQLALAEKETSTIVPLRRTKTAPNETTNDQ